MKASKLSLFLSLIALVVFLMLTSFFYFFTKEKDNSLKKTIKVYRQNSTKLIVDKIHADLLIDNLLEAQRQLDLLKESKIITEYQIIKKGELQPSELEYCEGIFFDKKLKTINWGKVCINLHQSHNEDTLANFKGLSLVFSLTICFTILLVIFFFRKITFINTELYQGIGKIINSKDKYNFENSFWAPVLSELNKLVIANKDAEKKLFDQKIKMEKVEMATQVAHDIRAPLATLENIDLNKLPDTSDRKLANDAIKRIQGIANTLLEKSRDSGFVNLSSVNLYGLVNDVLDAKAVEFEGRIIEKKLVKEEYFVQINGYKLESILSNLITNALEASEQNSPITINSEVNAQKYIITILDHGKGIPPQVLSKLGKEKMTFDKNNGNGLGILDATRSVNSWGGSLEIESQINIGTLIKISLPIFSTNNSNSINILIDNDELVCLTWKARAKKQGICLKTYKSSKDFFANESKLPLGTIFFIDSELDNEKGEDIAQTLHAQGFTEIYMASGYDKNHFSHLPFLKGVHGKTPPWS